MKKLLLTVMAMIALCLALSAQATQAVPDTITFDAPRVLSMTETYGTPVYEENDGKKHYLVALSGSAITLGGIFLWNRFLIGSGWTKVNWDYMFHFYEHEMKWDTDWYWTNFVLHPYQGGLSYLAGRSANLNRIESFALATLADFVWEYFCETNAPSKNDLVYSSIGAFPMGEMLYRLSLEAGEIHRLLGYALNPERMWPELLLRQRPRGTVGNIFEFDIALNVGTAFMHSLFGDASRNELFPAFGTPKLSIVYNDPYGHDSNNPYSQFNLDVSFGLGVGSGYGTTAVHEKLFHDVRVMSDGMLFARARQGERTDTTLGMVFEYDFIWNNMWLLSTLAPGFAVKQRIRQEKSDIEWQAHVAANVLGTTDWGGAYRSQVSYDEGLDREYSYTIGAETVLRWKWRHTTGHTIAVDFHGYVMYDFADQKQLCADTGWECIGLGTISYELPLSAKVRLGVQDEVYVKKTWYTDLDGSFQVANSASVYAKLRLK